MEGITYLERPALGVSLDSGPMEGASCLEPLEQSVLGSSLAARPVEGVTEKVSDWKPVVNPVISYSLDSQLMEGITYLEHLALGVSLDSRPMEGAPCLEPLEQSVLSSSLAARPIEGIAEKVSDRKPVINPVQNINLDGRPMGGITYPEHLAPGVSLDSGLRAGMLKVEPLPLLVHKMSCQVKIKTSHWKPVIHLVTDISTDDQPMKEFPYPAPLEQSVLGTLPAIRTDETDRLKCPTRTSQLYYEQSCLQSSARTMSDTDIVNHTDVNDDMNTDLPESLAPMLKSPMVFERPYVNSSAWPTLNPRIVNQTDVTFDMDTDPPENSAPMIDSDLMVVDWEDILYRRPGYCGGDLHDMMDTDRFDPDVWKRMDYAHSRPDGGETRSVDTADLVYM